MGTIDAEGHYDMSTLRAGDGVIPGQYKVLVTVLEKDHDRSTTLIAEKYGDLATTDLKMTVDKAKNRRRLHRREEGRTESRETDQ